MAEKSELDRLTTEWLAFTVKPQHETAVAASLETNGIETFVPIQNVRRRWSDRMQTVRVPLFTGYVLCKVGLSARLPVLRTPGVRSMVAFGSAAATIPEQEVRTIQRMIASGLRLEPHEYLGVGQRARIIRGPLTGLEGTLAGHAGKWSVVAGIELLNRSLSVEIEQDALEPIVSHPAG